MRKPIFKNERTLASAGSGKTYALTNRFIALVLSGANPEEICALTFTRKAAGEFFDKTMAKLALASSDDTYAKNLSHDLKEVASELPDCKASDFLNLLEKFARAASNLHLETIDAFASRFVRFFASELGIAESISILDEFSRERVKRAAISSALKLFTQDKDRFNAFAQAFKIANFGGESKRVFSKLEDFIDDAHDIFLVQPDASKWSNTKVFNDFTNTEFDVEKYSEILLSLEKELSDIADEKEKKSKFVILNFFKESGIESVSSSESKGVVKLAEHYAQNKSFRGFQVPLLRSRKDSEYFEFSDSQTQRLDKLVDMLFGTHLKSAHNATKAIHTIVSIYEKIYNSQARRRGKMTFSDMPLVIANAQNSPARELVEYRFDAKFSHWLFDEFQDTSRAQWKVFENIIREVVENAEGEKTFFYVGDIKQSIYAWRGGDSRLFDEIFADLNTSSEKIFDKSQLKTSWRSCPAIIDAINALFSDEPAIALQYGQNAANRWAKTWQAHDVANKNINQRGAVTVQCLDNDDDMPDAVYEYAKAINPTSRGLTCAVLVQRNDSAQKIIDTIRKRSREDNLNIRAAGELEIKLASDNMPACALLALCRASSHPSDTFSREYIKMTPLGNLLQEQNWQRDFLKNASDLGFHKALEPAALILEKSCTKDDIFSKTRITQFMEAAKVFDAQSPRDIDVFCDFMSKYKIREGSASDTIQVMSIHKSKGLDFDIVILPELGYARGAVGGRVKLLRNGEVVILPNSRICDFSIELTKIREDISDENAYESLCKFYVALTRAKRAMHFILPTATKNSDDKKVGKSNFAYLISDIFPTALSSEIKTCTQSSDPMWLEEFPADEIEQSEVCENFCTVKFDLANQSDKKKSAPENFLENKNGKNIGLILHSIFENLTKFECDPKCSADSVKHLYLDVQNDFFKAREIAIRALQNPQILNIFKCENFWVEKPYSIFITGGLECGRFDRVNFFDSKTRAEIIDFKTDANHQNLQDLYAPQLTRYARALNILTGIAEKNISLKIISTSSCEIFEIRSKDCGRSFDLH